MRFKLISKKNLKNKNISEKSNILLNKINKIFEKKDIKKYCKELSSNLLIPEKEILFYFKKLYFTSFNFKKNSFRKKISISSLFKFIFINLFFIVIIFFFKKKNIKQKCKKFDLLIDDVSDLNELKRYGILKKYFKSNIVRINKNLKLKKNLKKIIFRKNFINYNLSFVDFIFLLKMLNKNIFYSFKTNINLLYLFFKFINDYYFYSSFFADYKFKFIISSRHYVTNNIKNFIAKKNKTHCSVIQKNIDSENINGFFLKSDTLFTLGNKTKIINKRFCNFKKQVSVGSFFMEQNFYKNGNKNKNVRKFDILCLGGNEQYPGSEHDNYHDHASNYIKHLDWLRKISKDFPDIKVGFVHHANNKNDFEKNFFSNSKVKYIEKETNSYDLCNKSKFLCSWASTMVIEFFSLKKKSYYLDPDYLNVQFMKNINKNIRINTYHKFKKFYFEKMNKKTNISNYCINSKNTSYRIFKYLKKI